MIWKFILIPEFVFETIYLHWKSLHVKECGKTHLLPIDKNSCDDGFCSSYFSDEAKTC